MINWVIQPSRGCTRPASPLGDSKMPIKQQIFTARIAMRLENKLISDLWETSSWTIKCFPTTFCCCHPFFPRETWAGTSPDVLSAVPQGPVEWLWLAPAKYLGHRLSGEPSCLRAIVNASCLLQFSTKPYSLSTQSRTARGTWNIL